MSPSKFSSSVLLSAFASLLTFLSVPALVSAAQSTTSPEGLYRQTWRLVHDQYYDPDFNGKDINAWEHKFDGKLTTQKEAQQAINQLLAELGDPYTRYLDSEETQKEKDLMTNSQMVGIGVLIEKRKDSKKLYVSDTIEDSPALRAGIMAGDELLAIDGQAINELSPDECGQKIAGKEHSRVSLLISRDSKEQTIDIERQHLVLHPVTVKELDSNVGYIRLSSFLYGDATAEFEKGLLKMANKDGLIIDLRHNPGGQTFNALSIADMLMNRGIIVRTVDRQGSAVDVARGKPLTKQPIVVLVDQDSASASEILAAALKDQKRADIVGTKTYGKGLVQEIEPLQGGGALHLTVAQFMSPNGSKINHVGITPQVEVKEPEKQLQVAMELIKNKIAATADKRMLGRADAKKSAMKG